MRYHLRQRTYYNCFSLKRATTKQAMHVAYVQDAALRAPVRAAVRAKLPAPLAEAVAQIDTLVTEAAQIADRQADAAHEPRSLGTNVAHSYQEQRRSSGMSASTNTKLSGTPTCLRTSWDDWQEHQTQVQWRHRNPQRGDYTRRRAYDEQLRARRLAQRPLSASMAARSHPAGTSAGKPAPPSASGVSQPAANPQHAARTRARALGQAKGRRSQTENMAQDARVVSAPAASYSQQRQRAAHRRFQQPCDMSSAAQSRRASPGRKHAHRRCGRSTGNLDAAQCGREGNQEPDGRQAISVSGVVGIHYLGDMAQSAQAHLRWHAFEEAMLRRTKGQLALDASALDTANRAGPQRGCRIAVRHDASHVYGLL
jgi:hypothetical protein